MPSLLALCFLNPYPAPGMMVTHRPWLQVGRSILLLLSTALNFFALRYLQLDEVLSITFSTPFLVAVLCGPLLGEMGRLAAMDRHRSRLFRRAPGGTSGIRRIAPRPRLLCGRKRRLLRVLRRLRRAICARTDSSETTLFYIQSGGRAGDGADRGLRLSPPRTICSVIMLMVLIGASSGSHRPLPF